MRFPLHITTDMVWHQLKQAVRRNKRYPFVLMLEPLYACNLACIGCATERHTGKLKDRLTVDQCLRAVDDSGAPVVSICGGEPSMYPEIDQLVAAIIKRRRHIYLCTNGLLLDKKIFDVVPPHKRLTVNIHLDGMRATHDYVCQREGTFDKAVAMIEAAKARGYHVMTNTTVYKETQLEEVEELCTFLVGLGIDGMLVSPGYQYESVKKDVFLTKQDTQDKFKRILEISDRFPLASTPMFLEFAAGLRDYNCSPWSTVTYTVNGWKGPCYLIGKRFSETWQEFWTETNWAYWESRADNLCQSCAMHSGFEASVVMDLPRHPQDIARLLVWNLTRPDRKSSALTQWALNRISGKNGRTRLQPQT